MIEGLMDIFVTSAHAQAAQPPAATTDAKTDVALIALAGVLFSALVGAGVAWFTARNTVHAEHRKRQGELARYRRWFRRKTPISGRQRCGDLQSL
jgi:hypothetical protein